MLNAIIKSRVNIGLLILSVLLLGLLIGGTKKTLTFIDNIKYENASYIDSRLENQLSSKLNDRFQATLSAERKLYKVSYFNMDAGSNQTIYFRTYQNPFEKFEEIVKSENIRYNSLKIEASKLLDKE